jgi:uncharacterized protein
MAEDGVWIACRVAYVEVCRALALAAGETVVRGFVREWPAFAVVEVDQALCEQAARLAARHGLRSLDALHLAAALLTDEGATRFATWDARLGAAAGSEGLTVVP